MITIYKIELRSLKYNPDASTILLLNRQELVPIRIQATFFYGLGRAILKEGGSRARRHQSFKRRNDKTPSDTPLAAKPTPYCLAVANQQLAVLPAADPNLTITALPVA